MNVADLLGNPVSDHPDLERLPPSSCSPPQPIETTRPPVRPHRWLAATLATAGLLVGALVGWYAGLGQDVSQASVATIPQTAIPQQVAGVAELVTAMHLAGVTSPEGLADLEPSSTSTGVWVNDTAAIDISTTSDGLLEVLVAVDSLELIQGIYHPVDLQYFLVTVKDDAAPPVVVSPPARVPGPGVAAGLAPSFGGSVPPDQQTAITQFLDGYLTGSQEVARFMTPTARIPTFAQPPYTATVVDDSGLNQLGKVQVSLTATTGSGATHRLSYVIDTLLVGGVWEIAAISAWPAS